MVLVVALVVLLPVSMAIASERRVPRLLVWPLPVVVAIPLLLAAAHEHSDARGTLEAIAVLYACLLAGAVWIGTAMRNHNAHTGPPEKR